ncbi:MAG: hypothetical protein V4773_30110 [Verrucomicrobiota bacterium]
MKPLRYLLGLTLIGVGLWMMLGPKAPERVEVRDKAEVRQPALPNVGVEGARAGSQGKENPVVRPKALSAAEKTARIEQIKRDYDEVRAKAAADYSAAGSKFPGGLNAFLRQLALLEREKRADFALFLNPAELEDLEYRETTAGQLVTRLLGDTTTPEQVRREVFRKQLAFEDRFALTFDLSPAALLEREVARQTLQAEIRGVLGDAQFAQWLGGEGADFAGFARFVSEQRLPPERAFDLWQLKNEFIRKRLELNAQKLPTDQTRAMQGGLTRDFQARVVGILGAGLAEAAQREVLGWLPAK